MRQVKLGRKSDQIDWKNKDEIGSLVSEYNRMILELASSAELLAQSERESAWREMAKQVAHEIKNPLTPLRLSIQLLERAYRDKAPDIDQKVERLSKTMLEQIDTLSSIASAFSDFAKMPKPANEGMDLKALAKTAIDLFHETSEDVDFTFEDHGLEKAWIWADKEQLLRVFNNLFRNAIQAIPEDRKGRIEVTLSKQNRNFIIAVKDNGTGIQEEMIDKIFVPNFTTKTAGMGLGLAMVKNIVESCNGQIWFETTKDRGTTFHVSFPEYEE
jgi:two-component system, NtrC family, nitrogen regulation sensor histidine kinase NtrY